MAERILIVDFGSQVTQLIARRVREAGVYCEIVPFQKAAEALTAESPHGELKGIILSGGPASTTEEFSPRAPQAVFERNLPVFGICYGEQTICTQLGGQVETGHHREFGRAFLEIKDDCGLFDGVWGKGEKHQVWMSHGDKITKIPDGFRVVGVSDGSPYAAIADDKRKIYAVQFHPEVMHTLDGAKLLRNFVRKVAGCSGEWSMKGYRAEAIAKIRAQVGKGRVICGLSGGVDSSVAAVLIHEAIGEQLTCVFVDHGLLRKGEGEEVVKLFREHYNIPLIHKDASQLFLSKLAGVSDPETKRKTIGALFIDVFEEEAKKIGGAELWNGAGLKAELAEVRQGPQIGGRFEPGEKIRCKKRRVVMGDGRIDCGLALDHFGHRHGWLDDGAEISDIK